MATLVLKSYNAEPSPGSVEGIAIIFDFNPPFPAKTVPIKTVADVAAALDAYKAEAGASGKTIAVSIGLAKGDRAPPGFKKLRPFYGVNVPSREVA